MDQHKHNRVFVTGGSGFVGGHLIEALVASGRQVRALARSRASQDVVAGFGAEPVAASLGAVPLHALQGIDAVVHCAARAEDWGSYLSFYDANVVGTEQLLAAAKVVGVTRFVHISTEAVHFRGHDLVDIDESAPLAFDSPFPYSITKAMAEKKVLQENSDTLETIVLKPRLIWGPRDSSVMPAIQRTVEKGGFAWIDGGHRETSVTYVGNLVDAILAALERAPGGTVAFVVDAERHTVRSFLEAYLGAAGCVLPNRSLPGPLVRNAAFAMDWLWGVLGRQSPPPLTPFAATMMASTITIRSDAAQRAFGWTPRISFADGMSAVAASFGRA